MLKEGAHLEGHVKVTNYYRTREVKLPTAVETMSHEHYLSMLRFRTNLVSNDKMSHITILTTSIFIEVNPSSCSALKLHPSLFRGTIMSNALTSDPVVVIVVGCSAAHRV